METLIAGRYFIVTPSEKLEQHAAIVNEYTIGVTRYFSRHRLKIQGNMSLAERDAIPELKEKKNYFNALFQIELGI